MDSNERSRCVSLAAEGDPDALQRLLVHYHGSLRGFIATRLEPAIGRLVDAEDILQEAYADAFKSIRRCSFDGPGAFYKWLERIAMDRLRKTRRDLKRAKRDIRRVVQRGGTAKSPGGTATSYPDLIERLTSPGSSPSRQLARRDVCAAVTSSLARLTDEQRSVIRLRFLEGKSVAEVAAALDKTEPAIHMLTYRGLRALESIMGSITRYLRDD